jgi:nucleotide-binding universal stress UspA family protein
MLSVLLCFVAVAAGHYAAAGLGGRMLAMNATRLVREPVVLAVLERPECAPAQLAAALRLLEVFGPGRLDAMAIRAARREPAVPTEEVGGTVEAGALRLAEQDRTSSLKSAADRWAASAGAGPLIWSDPGGETGRLVGEAGRGADPIVLAHPPALRHQSGRAGLYAALFDAARPVLLLPADAVASFGDVIAVAWKNDVAARHAVLAALPLLQRAPRVVLLSDAGLTEPPLLFRDHAIAVDLRMFEGEEASLGERLLRAAHEARADLLVLGAFAHAPLHERVLGGVTRHVLDAANLPVFMQH